MSWFSDLTSKAEAFLVNLDQGASDVLQQPNMLLAEVKPFLDSIREPQKDSDGDTCDNEISENFVTSIETVESLATPDIAENLTYEPSNQSIITEHADAGHIPEQEETTRSNGHIITEGNQLSEELVSLDTVKSQLKDRDLTKDVQKDDSTIAATKLQPVIPRRFPIKTRKSKSHLFNLDDSSTKQPGDRSKVKTTSDRVDFNLGADNIRASINKSLQDYASQSTLSRTPNYSASIPETAQTSHYDDQMNVIHNDSTLDGSNSKTLRASNSFSIDVPDDRFHNASSKPATHNYLASRLMNRDTVKNYCAFYIHQVIDGLANRSDHRGQLFTLSDETRLKLRRAQLTANSYARRLNYNFRNNSRVKYMLILYLFALQLLVIYVLFFYQSSSSSTSSSLMNEIDRQQKLQDRGSSP